MDRAVFDLATELRVRYGIKTPDALHLAVALHAACEELWTNDRRLASAAEGRIRILTWDGIADKLQRKQPDSVNQPRD
jgi:predicted nucleic acid-binding protein